MTETPQPLYDLFISYRRQDASPLARSLRLRLQSFKLSNDVINRLPVADQPNARRRLRVYLDVAYERAANDFLDRKIIPALDASRQLAVISTPAAFDPITLRSGETAPNWLCLEIDHFLQSRGEVAWENLFVVLGPGASEDRFPGRLNEYRRWDWVDFREFKRSHWLSDATDAGLAKLIAGIYSLPDELLPVLRGEERKRRFRRLALAVVVAMLVAALTTGLAIAALRSSRLAEDRLSQALVQQSQSLAALAELRSGQGDGTLATLLSLKALPTTDGSDQRPYTATAEVALYRALVSAREKHVFSVSPCNATAIAVSASGQRFATGCFAGNRSSKVSVFNTETGQRVSYLDAGSARVDHLTFLPGDRLIAVGDSNGTIVLWDIVTGARTRTLRQDGLNALARDRSGKRLITATEGSTAIIWDLATGVSLRRLEHPGAKLFDASFSEAGDRALTASSKGEVAIWDSATGRMLQVLRHASVTKALFFGHDQNIIACGGDYAILWQWHAGHFAKSATLAGHISTVDSIAASPNGRMVATCSFDGTARLWDARSGKLLSLMSTDDSDACFGTAFSPDSTMLATVDYRKARVWRVPDGRPLMSLQSHTRPVTRLSFTPDGRRLITSSNGSTVSIWDVRREPNLVANHRSENIDVEWNEQRDSLFVIGAGHVTSIARAGASLDVPALKTDGLTRLYFISSAEVWLQFLKNGALRLVSDSGKGAVEQLTQPGQSASQIAVNRTAGVVVAVAQDRVLSWRLSQHPPKKGVVNIRIGPIGATRIDSSGTLLAVASKSHVAVYDLQSSRLRWTLPEHHEPDETEDAKVLRFSADGRLLLSSTEYNLTLWEISSGRKRCSAETDSPVKDATFSPDGSIFAIGTELGTFALYDSNRCTTVRTLDRTDSWAEDATVAFTRSGRRLLTAGGDGFAELWDVETGTRLQTFDNTVPRVDGIPSQEENDLSFAHFNVTEDRVVVASDHNVTIWSVLPEGPALIQRAKQLVPRDFLPQELVEYGLAHGQKR